MDFILAARSLKPYDIQRAAAEILRANPLGGCCGVVCPDTFCVRACVRKSLDRPVNIPAVQAFIVRRARDLGLASSWESPPHATTTHGTRRVSVAIVGGGPAGLACAAVLTSAAAIRVTLFEAHKELGGALHSIPRSRLPSQMIAEDAAFILSRGVDVRLETRIDDVVALSRSYDAVVVAAGLETPRRLGVPGEGCALQAMQYLWSAAGEFDVRGQSIAIVGGGPVAIDVATKLFENGARSVTIVYRRSEKEMTLTARERATLLRLGVDVMARMVCTSITGDVSTHRITSLKLRRCAVSGARRDGAHTQLLGDADFELTEFQRAVICIGNVPAPLLSSSPPNVLFAGDYVRGASTVVEASAFGKAAGKAVLRYLIEQPGVSSLTLPANGVVKSCELLSGYEFTPVPLAVSFFGMPIEHPFVLSASPLTDGLDECRRGLNAGWAGVVTKTAFAAQHIHVPNEYMTKFHGRYTYGNADNVSALPLETHCAAIATLRREYPTKLVVGSTGGPLTGDATRDRLAWLANTHMLEQAGAMAIE
jgi:NADPH-dependent glutamate synthase beta subunit-like oxidoreductase